MNYYDHASMQKLKLGPWNGSEGGAGIMGEYGRDRARRRTKQRGSHLFGAARTGIVMRTSVLSVLFVSLWQLF